MALDPQYQALADEVAALTGVEDSIEKAFAADRTAMADLQAKVDALTAQVNSQSPPNTDVQDGVAAVAAAVAQLTTLHDKLEAAIPQQSASTDPNATS